MDERRRVALKESINKVNDLEAQIAKLEVADSRTAEAIGEAERELERHANLDRDITRWRVDQVKKGQPTKVLPAPLKDRSDAKRAAGDELEQANSTRAAIREELDQLRAALAKAQQERMERAGEFLLDIGEGLGAELQTLNHRRAELIQLLRGLANVEVAPGPNARPAPIGLLPVAAVAFKMGDEFVFPHGADPVGELARRWKARMDAILANPDAEIAAPKHLLPSDYRPGEPGGTHTAQGWTGGTAASWTPEQV